MQITKGAETLQDSLSVIIFSIIVIALIIFPSNCLSGELVPKINTRPLTVERPDDSLLELAAKQFIYLHWNYISRVDGDRCRMKPSCSMFSHQAYSKHGFVKGTILTFDRLLHEGNEYMVSPVYFDENKGRMLVQDEIENNTFWWKTMNEKGGPKK